MRSETLKSLDQMLDAMLPQAARALMKFRMAPPSAFVAGNKQSYKEWCDEVDRMVDGLTDEDAVRVAMKCEEGLEEDRERAEYERLKEKFGKEVGYG